LGTPRYFGSVFGLMVDGATLRHTLAISRSRRADARLLRVVVDDRAQRAVGEVTGTSFEMPASFCCRDQVLLRDVELLELGVAGELDDLHAVLQRQRDAAQRVRRGDEHHVGEVVVEVEVVVVERVFCSGSSTSSSADAGSPRKSARHLVDLVEQEDRVVRAGLLERLDDLAGQRADVRAPVAADLGLVAHAAERDAHELAARGPRDGARERGLADAGRADEAQDGPLSFFVSACTARYSRMRSLIFLRP
jgi:hypothetical protein